MFDEVFAKAQRTLVKLMPPAQLHATALRFLEEGGELEEAKALTDCSIEYGEVRCQRGKVYEIDVTLRCAREVLEKLKRKKAESGWEEEPELKVRLVEALKASLPSGYDVADVNARARIAVSRAPEEGSAPAGTGNDTLSYRHFTEPESLAKVGRSVVDELVGPFRERLAKLGLGLPDQSLDDARYFGEISRILRAEGSLPKELKAKVAELLERARLIVAEYRKQIEEEFARKHLLLPLVRKETGRGLLSAVAGCSGMHQDYPERLTSEQAQVVSGILDYLCDYIDFYDDVEPRDLIRYEQEVSAKIEELERAGLAVFAGTYPGRMACENGTSMAWPVTVVLISAADDPRIKWDAHGKQYITGAIPRKAKEKETEEQVPSDDGRKEEAAAMARAQTEELKAEIRKAMEEIARQKDKTAQNPDEVERKGEEPESEDEEKIGRFMFRKAGRLFRVVFDGGPGIFIEDTLGARYLDYLLHHPREPITAYDLEVTITPEKADVRAKNTMQKGLDPDASRSYLREIEKLRSERERAADEQRADEVERLDGEIANVEAALSTGAVVADTGERARGNVSKAIRAVQRKLLKGDKHEKAFASHLDSCVSMGYNFCYSHPAGGVWQ